MSESITVDDVKAMKVADLRAALKARDLSTTGLKAELAQRLTDAVTGSASTAAAGDDPSGQTSGETTEVGNDAVNSTEDLPSELPATAPANGTDSVADIEGKEDTLETAAADVETSGTASEVVRPTNINTVDPVPGVVQETKAPDQTMPLADESEAGTKRKRDDETDTADMPVLPVNDASANVVEPVAVQEEKAAESNDSVPAAPADVEQPEYKKPKLDADGAETGPSTGSNGDTAAATDDIPVPSAGDADAPSKDGDVLQLVDTADAGSAAPADEGQSNDKPPQSASICVSNLARPFTLPQLRALLEDFGDIEYFWTNSIKSHCFVTFERLSQTVSATESLEGEIWPSVTGRPLSTSFVPTSKVAELVEKEEAAGRMRLELIVERDPASREWTYDVVPPAPVAASAASGRGQTAMAPVRGLASSIPSAIRQAGPTRLDAKEPIASASSARGPLSNRLFESAQGGRSATVSATSASGATFQIPSNSAFAQSRPVSGGRPDRADAQPLSSFRNGDADGVWQPPTSKVGETYRRTKATPQLYWKPVDMVEAGRKLRELQGLDKRSRMRRQQGTAGGSSGYSSAPRRAPGAGDSYRPR